MAQILWIGPNLRVYQEVVPMEVIKGTPSDEMVFALNHWCLPLDIHIGNWDEGIYSLGLVVPYVMRRKNLGSHYSMRHPSFSQ